MPSFKLLLFFSILLGYWFIAFAESDFIAIGKANVIWVIAVKTVCLIHRKFV